MFLIPTSVLGSWLRSLLAILIIGVGIWSLYKWYDHLPRSQRVLVTTEQEQENGDSDPRPATLPPADNLDVTLFTPLQRIAAWEPRADWPTFLLGLGVMSFVFAFFGRWVRALLRTSVNASPLPAIPSGFSVKLNRPDGTELNVEVFERQSAPTVILTHGWSMNRNEWIYLVAALQKDFRVITWDLPGLGKSVPPRNRDYSLEKMAADLKAIIDFSDSKDVTLVGHSIGGMIILTLCRVFPEILGTRIQKLALVHTTYINPIHTTRFSKFYRAIQKPIIEPLLYVQIALSGLVWIMTWMSYMNGSIHSSTMRNGFTRRVSRTKLNFVASFAPRCSPAVLARGSLGMLRYDATKTLPTIQVPVFIVAAADDPLTTLEASEYMRSTIPNSELFTMKPAKHFGLIEDDNLFANELIRFCGSTFPIYRSAVPVS